MENILLNSLYLQKEGNKVTRKLDGGRITPVNAY